MNIRRTFEELLQTASDLYAVHEKPEEALVYVERALFIEPTSTRALVLKGDILSELGRDKEALRCYDRAIEINPSDPEAYVGKGDYYLGLEMPEKALYYFQQAFSRRTSGDEWPSDTLFHAKAEALKMPNRKVEAINTVKEGLKENPDSDILLDLLARLEKENGT